MTDKNLVKDVINNSNMLVSLNLQHTFLLLGLELSTAPNLIFQTNS